MQETILLIPNYLTKNILRLVQPQVNYLQECLVFLDFLESVYLKKALTYTSLLMK